MILQFATWIDVDDYLKEKSGIILPIGSTEQHGPTGLIGTDALTAEAVAREAGKAAGYMVAPTLPFGMAQHHMAFPGSVTLKPSTLIAVWSEILHSLGKHGFQRFLFVNGHGGNIPSASAAFAEFLGSTGESGMRCRLINWWDAPGVRDVLRAEFGDGDGQHATASEISLTGFLYPEAFRSVPEGGLSPRKAPVGRYYDARDFRNRFPDGRIGSDPSLASPEKGEKLFQAAVSGLAGIATQFFSDPES